MPDDRFFHKRAGHSEKVNRLTDLEELAWRYYIESADDFGVMRFAAVELQRNYDRLAKRTKKVVQQLLEAVRDVGLIQTFPHQGHVYGCQLDWQAWQKVKHPRQTDNPKPPPDLMARCDLLTQELFRHWPGKRREKLPHDFGNVSETVGDLARAGARVTATATANGSGERRTAAERAGDFCEWYAEAHERFVGTAYIGNPNNDFPAALRLVEKLTDQEIRDAAIVWFGADDKFATDGTRTIPKFASRASGYLERVKARGLAAS